jgi:hypothetical protein
MPQRNIFFKLDTTPVQGEGSFVRIRKFLVSDFERSNKIAREQKSAAERGDYAEFDRLESEAGQIIADALEEWNWVDDEGQPLPQPKGKPQILSMLTVEEREFIFKNLHGNPQKK